MVKLLCRFYDPTRGRILWDGIDLRDLDPADLRRRVGAVFQDFMRYDLTAAENIAVGDVPALDDRARIERAGVRAGVDPALRALPKGYDTLLTRGLLGVEAEADPSTGVPLSGGQWQRLAVGRALMRDTADLLVLDEPSSGLDAEAEYDIHRTLHALRRGTTSLLISHRLGAVKDADRIVVLVDGRIRESGAHAQLMAAGGVYARLFGLQAKGYLDTGEPAETSPDASSENAFRLRVPNGSPL
jgi:ATP-binding cassette subfamily B protein